MKRRSLSQYTKEPMKATKEKAIRQLMRLNADNLEREVFNSCIIMKNLAIVYKDNPMSGEFILEELMNNSKYLRNTYADILSAYRNGKEEGSFASLYDCVPTKSAKRFAMILMKIDQINPSELVEYMTAFEETFAAERKTKGMKRAERKGLITTVIATATIFAILLNFTIVVVFMDTLKVLGQLF